VNRARGNYLGTEIDGKWWRRYTGQGWFARGNGDYWYDDEAFYFLRLLASDPIAIPLDEVREVEVGTWHSGRWAGGRPILKVFWRHEGQTLGSGFALAAREDEARQIADDLRRRASAAVGLQAENA
jgi:hypothetical protein